MQNLERCYTLLGIQPGASLEQIKQAYTDAEKLLHAERHADDPLVRRKAQDRLRAINEAYRAIIDSYEEVRASPRNYGNNGLQARRVRPMPDEGVFAAGSKHEGLPAPDIQMSAIGTGGLEGAESSGEKGGPATSSSDAATEDSPVPVPLFNKRIWLLFAVLAAVFVILLVRWIKPDQMSPASPAPANKAQPAGETPTVERDIKSNQPITPSMRREMFDFAKVRQDAEHGNPKAQALLGYFYTEGTGVGKDLTEAARWFSRAADQGNAAAQDWLGYLYETGQGVSRDYGKAVIWYRLAADQGNADAQKNLGLIYLEGKGVAKNKHEAINWLRRAAAQGNREAQQTLETWQAE